MRRVSVCIILLAACHGLNGQDVKWSARCRVTVDASRIDVKNDIFSYINRNLRSLRDIDIVSVNSEYDVSIVALQTSTTTGYTTGYAISTVVLQPINAESLEKVLEASKTDENAIGFLKDFYGAKVAFLQQYLQVGSTSDLPEMCQRIVTKIDGDVFQPSRESFQKWLDYVNRLKEPKKNN
jgi:hypothetical protein